ncbi:NADPH-dependent FMN reductase [Kiloniella sp. b19]|uniref:NADPH-dependent FMN reductase n=1 Tax=Kiloniella sp. GXU_MW_B19 TaxID=3141326 RepID=UPI0031D0E24C
MKVLAFAASSSRNSINKKLVSAAADLLKSASPSVEIELLDINDYELPLFSEDREKELGQPELAKAFYDKIGSADAVLVSYAEHNGTYSAAFKNIFDWTSRVHYQVFQNKPAVYLSTSPGKGGAKSVLTQAVNSAPHFKADLKASLSVPSFGENFDVESNSFRNDEIKAEVKMAVTSLLG